MRRKESLQFGLLAVVLAARVAIAGATVDSAVGDPATLRAAIADLTAEFAEQYPGGPDFLRRLKAIEARLTAGNVAERQAAQAAFLVLQREALLANPLVRRSSLLFVVRPQYAPDHHNTGTDFQPGEVSASHFRAGGALKVLDLARGGEPKTLWATTTGMVRDPDVDFDGQRIVFAMRRDAQDSYHLYEIQADGSGLRQLTEGTPHTDLDPAYLPDGPIVFASTRDPKYCGCNRHIQANLFVIERDGANLRQISRNNLYDSRPSVMPDGRILYDRWEYVDTMFGPRFGLWTVNPDGTQHALYCGNNDWAPGAIFDARAIPGTQRVVAVFGACHDRPWGAMVVLDRRQGLDGLAPLVQSWPSDIRTYMNNPPGYRLGDNPPQIDTFARLPVKYEDPYPLADPATGRGAGKYFLCARMTGRSEQMGLFLVDVFGNELLLHAEEPGCFDPMPLAPRPRPPAIPTRVDYAQTAGTCYVVDVYRGSAMERVPRGAIKWLRVVEAPPKRNWTGPMWNMDTFQAPAMNFNSTNNKRILGDVPVEDDGSAYFEVPADKFVFFQALDAEKQMVQSMRSGTTLMPGERTGCVGCHEKRLEGGPMDLVGPLPAAMRRPPSRLQPWYGPAREFNYLTEVQPVFDRHCVTCHDHGQKAGETLNLAGDVGLVFNTSYLELHRKSARRWFPDADNTPKLLIKAVHDGPPEVLPPYAWGSHRSRLVAVVRHDHYGVKLDREDVERIVTWIDLNAPYYGSYYSVYRDNVYGRSPLDDRQIARLSELTGLPYRNPAEHTQLNHRAVGRRELDGSQVSFTRPEKSPCLTGLDTQDPRYPEALAIIRAGQEQLARQPREDQLGPAARPVAEVETERCARWQACLAAEKETRQRLLGGRESREPSPGIA